MIKKRLVKTFFLILSILTIFFIIYSKFFKKVETSKIDLKPSEELEYKSNIIKDINYTTKDVDGNEYIIKADEAEIDYSNSNILFLTNVRARIKIKNSENIVITSNFGKYNTENFDTIFSKNVIIKYLENKISSEYLDFSLERSSMIISREVILSNFENILKADVIEIDIKTKDTKIFMYENQEKVNIQSIN